MLKIMKIRIVTMVDEWPDFTFIGEYTDDLKRGVIVRQYNEYYEKLTKKQKENIHRRRNEFIAFKPYSGGEKTGSAEYYEYGMQDYKRAESYNNNEWYFMGIQARAQLLNTETSTLHTISSSGLWGIESDSDESYLNTLKKEMLDDLKSELKAFKVDVSGFEKLTKNIKIERE